MARERVIIVGAGLAGFAAGTELSDRGCEVVILESNSYLGGRASDLVDRKMHDPVPIGPHVLCQWYDNFFALMRKVGAEKAIAWERQVFIDLVQGRTHHALKFNRLPSPLFPLPWIVTFPWMGLADKLSNLGMMRRIYFSSHRAIEALDTMTATEFLRECGVTQRAADTFWRFITLSLLNVPLESCSAAEFAHLVKKWAAMRRRRFGFPREGLGDLYADEAERYVRSRNGHVLRNHRAHELIIEGSRVAGVRVETQEGSSVVFGDRFITTLHPGLLVRLLPNELLDDRYFSGLRAFESVPYISVNLWFDRKVTRKQFWAMISIPGGRQYLNTDFYDFSNIYRDEHRGHGSYIASNIINSGSVASMSDAEIVETTLQELRDAFPAMHAELVHSHVHRIPHVVYAPRPGMRALKRGPRSPLENLYVSGDWTIAELPQCMEAAVRSGYRAAEAILADLGRPESICIERPL